MLPNSFAIKSNIGCGCNIIVPDKSNMDIALAIEQMHSWKDWNKGHAHAEMQYDDVEPKILVEKYLKGLDGSVPADYKLYCFNGKVRAILYMAGRFTDHPADVFYDADWNYLGLPLMHNGRHQFNNMVPNELPTRPGSLDEMVRNAELLSREFPFVRVDYYDVGGRAVFGEMTFTPAAGFDTLSIPLDGKDMGEYIQLFH